MKYSIIQMRKGWFKMKKVVFGFILVIVSVLFCNLAFAGSAAIIIDGNRQKIASEIIDGKTYAPLDSLCKALDSNIEKNDKESKVKYIVTRAKAGRKIELQAESQFLTVNGITKKLSFDLIVVKKEVMVPLVTIVENLGGEVIWCAGSNTIIINSYSPVIFKDKSLEAEVRTLINKPTEAIFKSDVDSISMLNVSGKNITDIEGLQYFTNLTYLDLSNNNIKDITPIRQLSKLKVLFLKTNPIQDYAPASAIYNALEQRDFEIGNMNFNDSIIDRAVQVQLPKTKFSYSIDDLKTITELDLRGKNISDLRGIQYLTNLKMLNLADNKIKDLSVLKNLTNLKVLILSSNLIEDIEPLSYLHNLQQFDLYNNKVSDISALGRSYNLKQLSLWKNNISDISPIGNLANLEVLVLSDNNLTKIDALSKLERLSELYLGGNYIFNFDAVKGYYSKLKGNDFKTELTFKDPKLEKAIRKYLNVGDNKIRMEDAANVKILSLSLSDISDLDGIQCFTNLESLTLTINNITDINVLKSLHKLRYLNIQYNKVTDISPLGELKELSNINLSFNKITDISILRNLNNLGVLLLKGNKISDFSPIYNYYDKLKEKDFECKFVKVTLNGEPISFDVAPVNKAGVVLVPISPIFKALNMKYEYNGYNQTVYASDSKTKISIKLGSIVGTVNGVDKKMKSKAEIFYGRMCVPVSFIGECIGADVKWDGEKNTVVLTTKQ